MRRPVRNEVVEEEGGFGGSETRRSSVYMSLSVLMSIIWNSVYIISLRVIASFWISLYLISDVLIR